MTPSLHFVPSQRGWLVHLSLACFVFAAFGCDMNSPSDPGARRSRRDRVRVEVATALADPRLVDGVDDATSSDGGAGSTGIVCMGTGHGFAATEVTSLAMAQVGPQDIVHQVPPGISQAPAEPETAGPTDDSSVTPPGPTDETSETHPDSANSSPEIVGLSPAGEDSRQNPAPAVEVSPKNPGFRAGISGPNGEVPPGDCPDGRCPLRAVARESIEPRRDGRGRVVMRFAYQTLDGNWRLNNGRFPEPLLVTP